MTYLVNTLGHSFLFFFCHLCHMSGRRNHRRSRTYSRRRRRACAPAPPHPLPNAHIEFRSQSSRHLLPQKKISAQVYLLYKTHYIGHFRIEASSREESGMGLFFIFILNSQYKGLLFFSRGLVAGRVRHALRGCY